MNGTFFSLFSGFDLAGVGAQQAGLECIGGIEYSAPIAEVAQANGHPITVADIRHVDFKKFDKPSHLWMSPVCTNASVANANGAESALDILCALACCNAIRTWTPEFVFLENVYGYRHFKSFGLILNELQLRGYGFDYWNLNSADYSVPQTRRRLILIARRDGRRPQLPMATHSKLPSMFTERWRGWYEAIEDLLPDLPESEFADWQIARLPKNIFGTSLVSSIDCTSRHATQPANTIVSCGDGHSIPPKAFLCDDQTSHAGAMASCRDAIAPAFTVSTRNGGGNVPRAFICEGSAAGIDNKFNMPVRDAGEPIFTQRANQNNPRAFIASGMANDRGQSMTARIDGEPVFTVNAQAGGRQQIRAWLKEHGRTVKMTPRALMRFQDGPDDYVLPDSAKLACKGIGNGVACGLARAVIESTK